MFKKSIFFFCFLLAAFGASFYFDFWKKEFHIPKSKSATQKKGKERDMVLGKTNFKKTLEEEAVFKPYLDKQWALKDIGVVKAWKETKGRSDVVVAVCDTGIHSKHPCLKFNLWVNKKEIPDNGIDDDKNGYIDDINGWNFVDNNNKIQDRHGHGTHISGLIAATGKTKAASECRMIGVAPKVKIMTLKYYDMENGENNIKNTVKCVDYAINNGAHIINYSGGGPGENLDERASIAKANDKGILFIAASGNEGEEIEKDSYYPASYNLPNIISVNSKNPQGNILESSNWVKMDWKKKKKIHNQTAPGERILSTLPPKRYLQSTFFKNIFRGLAGKVKRSIPETFFNFLPNSFRNIAREKPLKHNNYGYMTGTSQATGIVTGVAALIKSHYPKWSYLQIRDQIDKTGYSAKTQNIKQKTNQGKVLNAHEAISMRGINITVSDTSMPLQNKDNFIIEGKGEGAAEIPLVKENENPLIEAQKMLQKKMKSK